VARELPIGEDGSAEGEDDGSGNAYREFLEAVLPDPLGATRTVCPGGGADSRGARCVPETR
jgi:hypothetical protein